MPPVDTTWERIAKAVRDHVPGERRLETFRQLATLLLLTYALRNADCHAKNVALLYTSRANVHLAPAYDMLTTQAYAGLQHNPPGIGFMGKKTWAPGKNLQKFIAANFGIQPREPLAIVESISDAVADVELAVREAMTLHDGFDDIGRRMLLAWAREFVACAMNGRIPPQAGRPAPPSTTRPSDEAEERVEQDRSIALARQEVADACRRPVSQCGGARYQNRNQKSS